jgi:hypothetical protein
MAAKVEKKAAEAANGRCLQAPISPHPRALHWPNIHVQKKLVWICLLGPPLGAKTRRIFPRQGFFSDGYPPPEIELTAQQAKFPASAKGPGEISPGGENFPGTSAKNMVIRVGFAEKNVLSGEKKAPGGGGCPQLHEESLRLVEESFNLQNSQPDLKEKVTNCGPDFENQQNFAGGILDSLQKKTLAHHVLHEENMPVVLPHPHWKNAALTCGVLPPP